MLDVISKLQIPEFAFSNELWLRVRDGNRTALAIFQRHYSKYHYKDGRKPLRFVGPGERIVLITACGKALFVWRKFKSMDNQDGINCSVFRNESSIKSSVLILAAEQIAFERWGHTRLYTYVNASLIKSTNPGYCFKVVGWKFSGTTKKAKLHILEKQI